MTSRDPFGRETRPQAPSLALEPSELDRWQTGINVTLRPPGEAEQRLQAVEVSHDPWFTADLKSLSHSYRLTEVEGEEILIDLLYPGDSFECGTRRGKDAIGLARDLLAEGREDIDVRFERKWFLARYGNNDELELFRPDAAGPDDLPCYIQELDLFYRPLPWRLVSDGEGGYRTRDDGWQMPLDQATLPVNFKQLGKFAIPLLAVVLFLALLGGQWLSHL